MKRTMKQLRERDIERHLIKQARLMGGQVRKVKWIGRRGAPDRRVMMPRGSFWIELKAPGKGLEAHQAREINLMRGYGEAVYVMSTLEGIDGLLEVYA